MPLAPTVPVSAAAQALLRLRQLIASGQLAAGQPLLEIDLAQRLSVSRPTLREALRELEADGLADRSRARGLAVRRLTRRDVRELYDIREALEALSAARAATRLKAAPEALRRPFTDQLVFWQQVATQGSVTAFSEANRRLHAQVLAAADNQHLPRLLDHTLIDLFAAQLRAWIVAPQILQSAAEHVELLETLLAGHAGRAERVMRAHVRSSARTVLALPNEAF